jgi:hypothetical protein
MAFLRLPKSHGFQAAYFGLDPDRILERSGTIITVNVYVGLRTAPGVPLVKTFAQELRMT